MTAVKLVGVVGTTMSAGAIFLLQAAGTAPEITGAVLLSAGVLAVQLYLIRRVNAIPSEQSKYRHDQTNQIAERIAEQYLQLDNTITRLEARVMGAIEAGLNREGTERHRLEDRVREVERDMPRRGDR